MTRCIDFWKKWRKEPNFCGLSTQAISEIKGYLELVDKIARAGIPEETIFELCPSGACRPVLRLSDDETRLAGINYIVGLLKQNEKISQKMLQSKIDEILKKEQSCAAGSTHLRRVEKAPLPVEKDQKPATPQPSLAAQIAGAAPAKTDLHKIPGCLGNGGCPKKRFRQEGARSICGELGVEIINLPDRMCPYDRAADVGKSVPAPANSSEIPNSFNNLEKPDSSSPAISSPFKTGTQVQGGIAGEMFPADKQQPDPVATAKEKEHSEIERRELEKAEREELAVKLLSKYPGSVQVEVADILRDNKSWKTADAFYFGIEALIEKRGRRR